MNNSRAVECYSLAGQAESEDNRPRGGRGLTQDPTARAGAEQTAAGSKALFSEELIHPPSPRSSDTCDTLSVPCHVCHV